jgi:serine protease Do
VRRVDVGPQVRTIAHPGPRGRSASARSRALTAGMPSAWPGAVRLALLCGVLSLLLALLCPPARAAGEEDRLASPFVTVGREVRPAVVNIRTVRSVTQGGVDINPLQEMFRRFFPGGPEGGEKFELPGSGSGFVVSADGHILTNHHVIAQADAIHVRFTRERQEYEAVLVGSDPNTDLALLKIEADRPLRPLAFGDSDAVEVGEWAIAIGNPFGHLEGSLTVGVVSAKGRSDLVISGLTPRYQDFLQTDASINFGNSGGPLVDITGAVIGVNTAVNTGGQGISFAIPSNLARRIYEQLRDHGRVIRGYLGIRTAASGSEGALAADDGVLGARITAVLPGSPAAEAGLEEGDLIVSFAGEEVGTEHRLQFLIAESPVGRDLPCEIVRDGERRTLAVRLVEQGEDAAAEEAEERWLGLEVASLSDPDPRVSRLRETLGIDLADGVIVLSVDPGSSAAEAGIRPGDVLVSLDGEDLPDLATYRRLRSAWAGRQEPIRARVRTGTIDSYVMLQPRSPELEQ